jgi:RNA binding exosome subunit
LSTIAHATDDLAKVESALQSILPLDLKQREIFNRRYLQGHYGNPIVTFEARLTRPSEVDQFVYHFIQHLSKSERLLIERDMDLHSDHEGNLFIRVDKQHALLGSIKLGDDDPIRVKMKFSRLKGNTRELMKSVLEMK